MDLIIVESPTKAKTLSRFLGSGYAIEATMGHVKDLPKSKLGVDLENNFKPDYVFVEKKRKTVNKILSQLKTAANIYIATDPDREGEAIAAHVNELLIDTHKSKIKKENTYRIVFHEITKEAVENAIKSPRGIDFNLVNAQIARRVLDRIVGYKLSPLLWKKVRRGLSAGRVQSVAVRLIVEKEREITAFKAEEFWEITAEVAKQNEPESNLLVKLIKIDNKKAIIGNKTDADKAESELKNADYKVSDIKKREVKKSPYPPFTTSTMTQAAARIFFWSAKKTMNIAQKLYEEGLITYHRTDSVTISKRAVTDARVLIEEEYGKEYLPDTPKFYKTKSKNAQEAHEAIRPTNIGWKWNVKEGKYMFDAKKLYGLIKLRFLACQMKESIYNETVIDVSAKKKRDYLLRAIGQTVIFDGWKVLYENGNKSTSLPPYEINNSLDLLRLTKEQKFTQPPARYNEASLIKTLEKMGIGRPSTYAPIITTIQTRMYVEKDDGRFKPTPIGFAVNDFLVKHFPDVFDYDFTATMEDNLDKVANGDIKWTGVMSDFWKPFEKKVVVTEKKAERVEIKPESTGIKCPKCKNGEKVIRIGRFGKFISCSQFPDCDYKEKYIEKLNFKCPQCAKGDVIVKRTSRGKKFYGCSTYPSCKWASWKKPVLNEKANQKKKIK